MQSQQQKGGNTEAFFFFFFLFFSVDEYMCAQLCGFLSSHIFQCACLLRIAGCELCKCETLWRYFRQLKNVPFFFFCHRGKTQAKLYRRYLARCREEKRKGKGKKEKKQGTNGHFFLFFLSNSLFHIIDSNIQPLFFFSFLVVVNTIDITRY